MSYNTILGCQSMCTDAIPTGISYLNTRTKYQAFRILIKHRLNLVAYLILKILKYKYKYQDDKFCKSIASPRFRLADVLSLDMRSARKSSL